MLYRILPILRCRLTLQANGFTALEMEQRITYPIENAMSGMAENGTKPVRIFTLRLIASDIIFEDGTDIYWARQLITALAKPMGEMP